MEETYVLVGFVDGEPVPSHTGAKAEIEAEAKSHSHLASEAGIDLRLEAWPLSKCSGIF